jgi:hypothetical protein
MIFRIRQISKMLPERKGRLWSEGKVQFQDAQDAVAGQEGADQDPEDGRSVTQFLTEK